MSDASSLVVTWLGHATFLFDTPGRKRVIVDPWLGNPSCPPECKDVGQIDLILITHGHSDHIEDAPELARKTGAPVVGNFEICTWLGRKGVQNVRPMNKGGTQEFDGIRVSMVDAVHSSGYVDESGIVYLGEAGGYVIAFPNAPTIYFAGDTAVFGDMALIRDLYTPEVAFLPIGDLFTMGPVAAARATALLGVRQVVPMHYGTFPALTGSAGDFRALVEPQRVRVVAVEPGIRTQLRSVPE